jgi:hypothetical protein
LTAQHLHHLWAAFGRGLLEQSVGERLLRAAAASALMWLAIWWALG